MKTTNVRHLLISVIMAFYLFVLPSSSALSLNNPEAHNGVSNSHQGTESTATIQGLEDSVRFLHFATPDTISFNWTFIDHPKMNGNPNALVFVSQNWNPGGGTGIVNEPPIAVFYYSAFQQWVIRNLSGLAMPLGAYFNVMALSPGHNAFVNTSSLTNTTGDTTYINHPLTNKNPNPFVYTTRNMNPGDAGFGPAHYHETGVVFDSTEEKWGIFNQDAVDMAENVSFNVLVMAYRVSLPVFIR